MRFALLALAAIPVLVSGAELTARAALNMVPATPDSAQAAYAQWRDENGQLKTAGQLKAYEDAINAWMTAKSQAAAQKQMAGMNPQMSSQMQAAMNSPEAAAKLQAQMQSMTPAQLMAMAQSMQPQMPRSAPVSDHDQALIKQINVYPGMMEVDQQVQKARMDQAALDEQWKAQRDALNEKMRQDHDKLPACPGEAGEPAADKVRDLELKYADQRIAAVGNYLAKSKAIEQRTRAAVAPRVAYGDQAMAAWSQLQGEGIKQMTESQAQAALQMGISDSSSVAGIVENASHTAAEEIINRKRVVDMYKDIRPGCG